MSDLDVLLESLCGSPPTLKEFDLFSASSSSQVANSNAAFEQTEFKEKPSKYSEYGQQIKEIMKSRSNDTRRNWTGDDEANGWCNLQAPAASQSLKNPQPGSSVSFVEPNSKLAVVSAQIASDDLKQKLSDKSVISLNRITPSNVPNPKQGHNWVTFAVVARKLPPKESAKGRPFSVWYLTDLQDMDKLETLFIFGAAHEAHWKLPERTVIGLLNPDVKEDREKGQLRFTLSIDHPLKMLVVGQSRDFSICQSHTKAGEKCSKIVNKAKSEFCIFHAMTLLKKGAKRPELAPSGSQSFLANKRPRMDQVRSDAKRVASSITASAFGPCLQPGKAPIIDCAGPGTDGNASVSSGLPSANRVKSMLPASGPGVMNVEKFEDNNKRGVSFFSCDSAGKLLPSEKVDTTSWGRTMLQSLEAKMNKSQSSSVARARRERLAALIKSGQQPAPNKIDPNRPNTSVSCLDSPKQAAKENKTQPEVTSPMVSPDTKKDMADAQKILEAQSRHSTCIDDAFNSRQEAYFRALEPRDRAEKQLSETFKIKVKAAVCKKCLYVASSAADRCKKEHPSEVVGPIDAWRRFFACRECHFRTTTFSRFPDYCCNKCKSSRWKPAPVRELAKFHAEKLSIGVEELPHLLDGGDGDDDGTSGLEYGISSS